MTLLEASSASGPLGGLELGDHLCLPIESDRERLAATVRFTDIALSRGGKVVVFTYTETAGEMAAHLAARVPAAAAALASGQLEPAPYQERCLVDGRFDPGHLRTICRAQIDLAERQGYSGLWIAVDMARNLSELLGASSLIDYEASANPIFADRRRAAVCIYNRSMFHPEVLDEVCSAHPMTPGQAPLRFAQTHDPLGLTLQGEVDFTNRRALAALLNSLHAMPGHITIDTTGLSFADMGAADLLCGTSVARSPNSTTIVGSPVTERLLTLLDATMSHPG